MPPIFSSHIPCISSCESSFKIYTPLIDFPVHLKLTYLMQERYWWHQRNQDVKESLKPFVLFMEDLLVENAHGCKKPNSPPKISSKDRVDAKPWQHSRKHWRWWSVCIRTLAWHQRKPWEVWRGNEQVNHRTISTVEPITDSRGSLQLHDLSKARSQPVYLLLLQRQHVWKRAETEKSMINAAP